MEYYQLKEDYSTMQQQVSNTRNQSINTRNHSFSTRNAPESGPLGKEECCFETCWFQKYDIRIVLKWFGW